MVFFLELNLKYVHDSHRTNFQLKGPTYMHFSTPLYTAKRQVNELCLIGKETLHDMDVSTIIHPSNS